jgi:hypothetical protein
MHSGSSVPHQYLRQRASLLPRQKAAPQRPELHRINLGATKRDSNRMPAAGATYLLSENTRRMLMAPPARRSAQAHDVPNLFVVDRRSFRDRSGREPDLDDRRSRAAGCRWNLAPTSRVELTFEQPHCLTRCCSSRVRRGCAKPSILPMHRIGRSDFCRPPNSRNK